MEETVNQGQEQQTAQQVTFTQEDVNRIVADRLSRERSKFADYEDLRAKAEKFDAMEEASKTELQKAQELAASFKKQLDDLTAANKARDARDKVASETGVPVSLLHGSTEEECKQEAEALLKFRGGKPTYPNVRDAGEPHQTSGGKTRDQFSDWFHDQIKGV